MLDELITYLCCMLGVWTYSWIIVGRKTGMELNATLQLKNMNY